VCGNFPCEFRKVEISQSKVHEDLAEYLPSFRTAVAAAVSGYEAGYSPRQRTIHTRRSRASLIHDHIVANIAKAAEGWDDVKLVESKMLWLVSIPGYLIRIKKVGPSKLPSGHRTRQVRRLRSHKQLDGLPQAISLDLSYELNQQTGELRKVYLICPSGVYGNMWDSELESSGETTPVVVSLFNAPASTDPSGATLRPKKGRNDEAEPGDGGPST
jgi:hypothetical protein